MRGFVRLFALGLACLTGCGESSAPVEIRAVLPVRVGDAFEPARVTSSLSNLPGASVEAPAQVTELVFGPSRAAYDRSGWSPRPLPRRRADESYTASEYDFHYADVPGHPGIRAATNFVMITLADGAERDVVLGILEAERAEIVGQVPIAKLYQLRLPTTSFEEGMAATARIRATPGVFSAAYAAGEYFGEE